MTDKDKLQQLFDAALQDGSSLNKVPTRAFPVSKVARAAPVAEAVPAVAIEAEAVPSAVVVSPAAAGFVEPLPNAGLDEATTSELGKLLDEQHGRVSLRRRRELVATLLVLVGVVGGGLGWFVSSPMRVSAFSAALSEIRSVGDVKGMMAKYQVALDKIGTRGGEIDGASQAMGMDPSTVKDEDPYLDAETEAFTGEKDSGVGSRNKKLQEKFGKVVKSPLMAGEDAAPLNP